MADYIKETKNHVLYRVTPIFVDDELVARGVQMEGYSQEDAGKSICFNVFCYNVQPGIIIDYTNGDSRLMESEENESQEEERSVEIAVLKYIIVPDRLRMKTWLTQNIWSYLIVKKKQ